MNSTISVNLLGTASPIFLVGESHTLIFRNLLFRAGDSQQLFQTRTRYLPHVLAQNFCNPDLRAFHEHLLEALRAEELLRPDLSPAHHSLDGSSISGAWMERRAVIAPPLVLCIGDLDIHHLLTQFADYDFELPGDCHYGVDHSRRPVAYATIRAQMEKLLAPFTNGLLLLRAFGFTRMMVHCVPPRTPDNAATLRWTQAPKAVRAKLTVIANQILAHACAAGGIPFIDVWPQLCQEGYLLPQYDLDGTHLTQAAALISLEHIVRCLHQHSWDAHNIARYQHAITQAPRYARTEAGASAAAAVVHPAPGLRCGQLDASPALLATLADGTQAAQQACPQAQPTLALRLDWASAPAGSTPALHSTQPGAHQLALAAKLLGQGVGQALLQGELDYALTVSSFRPSHIAAGATPQVLARAAHGAGLLKAVLRLGSSGNIVFAAPDGRKLHSLPNTPGALAVYDPSAVLCVLDAAKGDISLVELALTPLAAGQPFRVVWSGPHEWPLDPFQYGVSGMLAYPPFDDEQVTVRALAMA